MMRLFLLLLFFLFFSSFICLLRRFEKEERSISLLFLLLLLSRATIILCVDVVKSIVSCCSFIVRIVRSSLCNLLHSLSLTVVLLYTNSN